MEKLTMPQISDLVGRAHKNLTATQRDGFGFTLGALNGHHYTEKWDKPSDFPGANKWPSIAANLSGLPVFADCVIEGEYPSLTPACAMIAHARTSTCAGGAENAHPHVRSGWSLVHNGVVEPLKGKTKPCDSIHILDSLVEAKGADKLAGDVAGYLAILAIDPRGHLLALRDAQAPLCVSWVPSFSAWAFASSPELLALIVSAPHDRAYTLKPFFAARHDGRKWGNHAVKPWASSAPRRRAGYLASAASKAFGKALDDEAEMELMYDADRVPAYSGSSYVQPSAWSKKYGK